MLWVQVPLFLFLIFSLFTNIKNYSFFFVILLFFKNEINNFCIFIIFIFNFSKSPKIKNKINKKKKSFKNPIFAANIIFYNIFFF